MTVTEPSPDHHESPDDHQAVDGKTRIASPTVPGLGTGDLKTLTGVEYYIALTAPSLDLLRTFAVPLNCYHHRHHPITIPSPSPSPSPSCHHPVTILLPSSPQAVNRDHHSLCDGRYCLHAPAGCRFTALATGSAESERRCTRQSRGEWPAEQLGATGKAAGGWKSGWRAAEVAAGVIPVVHRLPPVPLDRTGFLPPQRTACRVHVQRAAVRLRSAGGRHLRCTSDLPLPRRHLGCTRGPTGLDPVTSPAGAR